MPATCRLIVTPTTTSVAPCATRCTGVIDMTATIVAWLSASAMSPVRTPFASATLSTTAETGRSRRRRSAILSGSGRSATRYRTLAIACAARVNRNGPDSSGRPTAMPTASAGAIRFGPAIAPTVVAQTTSARSRPRCRGSERSVAAKRDCRFTAVPTPMSASARSSSGSETSTAARMPTTAPSAAVTAPVASAGARPARRASRASGTDANAAPTVVIVAAMPDQAGDPLTWVTSRAPADSVEPIPIPASTCPAMSTARVRLCARRTCSSLSSGEPPTGTVMRRAWRRALRRGSSGARCPRSRCRRSARRRIRRGPTACRS